MFSNFSHIVFTILLTIILLYYAYEYVTDAWKKKSETENYIDFSKELHSDMNRYGISDKDQQKIEDLVEKIIEKKKNEKNLKTTMGACKNGLIKGAVIGAMTATVSGDFSQVFSSGCTHGILNTFMHHFID